MLFLIVACGCLLFLLVLLMCFTLDCDSCRVAFAVELLLMLQCVVFLLAASVLQISHSSSVVGATLAV